MSIDLLVVTHISSRHQRQLKDAGVRVHMAEERAVRESILAEHRDAIRAVLTIGTIGFSAEEMDELPNLGLICARGVGFEGIDVQAAHARGIQVTHGPGTNAETVADHTLGLVLAALRAIPARDAAVRRGEWREAQYEAPALHGKTLGLLGMGNIARAVARRALYGFDMPVIYYSRRPKPELPYEYEHDVRRVAERCDILVSTLPGGPETHHLIDAALIKALGAHGMLVNVGRGSVVDTQALIEAVRNGHISGAALDVVEGEPGVPEALKTEPSIVLTPHVAGKSPQALDATVALVIKNLTAFAADEPLVTPVMHT
ncbi:2-hydroxyacid dehydrogenase [Phytohalomonas tamaricis]|uniref:2-hydroxyacid dehydrogenase n=1 Tax=Phytohalomonas tamaricis TaxID=2081032 RepID=UPI000D0B466B|nr:2-hydroxyacid dehydrogenase [Phytohalomonas tamaricis]